MDWAHDINLMVALPEIVLLGALLVILLVDLWVPADKKQVTYGLTLIALLGLVALQIATFPTGMQQTFSQMYIVDPLAMLTKIIMTVVIAVILVYSRQYLQERGLYHGEFCLLTLFALLGMNVMVSASHFLTLYIGLELLSLALYTSIALQRDSVASTEAAMKYFVLGALASGLFLYGVSMVYGATGVLHINEVARAVQSPGLNPWLLAFGLVFLVAGIGFKLGVVPFHMWVPDVYQGSPTAVTLLIGSAPKLAAVAFIIRILVQGLEAIAVNWQGMLIIIAVLSMAIGNITAIAQTNIKRMLAYSTIAHMGFLLLGLIVANPDGYASALFYAVVYVLMSLVGFGILLILSRHGFECENLDDLRGLNQRNSWYALLMLLAMFSMAGIPPLVGFYAKFMVIRATLQAGLVPLAVFAVLMSLIGAFYYLRVVKALYFDEVCDNETIVVRTDMKWLISLNALALLVLGILPESLLTVCVDAMKQSLVLL